MLSRLRELFSATEEETVDDEAALHLAAAVLLVEVAKSDHSLDSAEIDRLRGILRRDWDLGEQDLQDLVEAAKETSDEAASLHHQVSLINDNFSIAQKRALVRGMWQVACADGELHHHEELLIRRVADLLYLPHSDFIRAKHQVLDQG